MIPTQRRSIIATKRFGPTNDITRRNTGISVFSNEDSNNEVVDDNGGNGGADMMYHDGHRDKEIGRAHV